MAHPSDPNSERPPDVAGFLHHEASGDNPLLPDPDVNTARQRPDARMETLQSSLVERIAGVDDERRRSATQLHRALETQRSELAVLVKRHRMGIALVAVLMILLTTLSVGIQQFQLRNTHHDLNTRIEQLQQRVAQIQDSMPASPTVEGVETVPPSALEQEAMEGQLAVLRKHLASLIVDVNEIKAKGSAVAAMKTNSTTAAAPLTRPMAASATVVTDQPLKGQTSGEVPIERSKEPVIPRLDALAGRSATVDQVPAAPASSAPANPVPEIEALEPSVPQTDVSAAKMSEVPMSEASVTAVTKQGDGTGTQDQGVRGGLAEGLPELEPESAPEAPQAPTPPTEPALVKTAGPVPADKLETTLADETQTDEPQADETQDSQSVEALVNALIDRRLNDRRLDEIDRHYQRLAREFSAPALRPRQTMEAEPNTELANEAQQVGEGAGNPASAAQRMPASTSGRVLVDDRPFALQLIGFYSRELLDDFIARNPLPDQVYLREETFRGRPWFVLIHSLYQDRAAAQQASADLPEELGALDLWIRELPADTALEVISTPLDQG
ncbi:MAG: hypothetical protein C1943_01835 [Halochromatium sp.]|nr:hypothetical protein [Halochromatium sp.]